MSTTQANLPVAGTQETPPRPAAPVSYGNPSGPAAHRLSRLWLLTPVVIIVLALTAFGLWRQFVAPKIDDNISLYSVKMTSFPIVLKEKGDLKAHKSVDIKCEIEGGSTIIWIIPEGTRVEKGDLLVELASDTIQQKIDQQRITVNTAQNTYDTARAEYEIGLAYLLERLERVFDDCLAQFGRANAIIPDLRGDVLANIQLHAVGHRPA